MLKLAFPDVVHVERPVVELPKTINPHWLAGFTSGEGSFLIEISASKMYSVGSQVRLVFQLTQHSRDYQLLFCIYELLGCGHIYKKGDGEILDFRVRKLDDIINKIIPFFNNYPIRGVKALDFADFIKAAELMKKKNHLTKEGFEEIKQIKAGMNRGRKLN